MKFTLKDYQEEAVARVLTHLHKARRRWHDDGDKHAFSLTAATGAGKTVMAAAVFEALFFGDDETDIPPDPGAVVIWFSDDPSLNEQSRARLSQASDKLHLSNMQMVESTFNAERFQAGNIYFLNTQKLSKSSLLVRGHDPDDPDGHSLIPDLRTHTIWDTIRNTIAEPELTLYLILDEAHRGMKEGGRQGGKPTIVRQLINGSGGVPGIPIVWGISATVQRFNDAMAGMQDRATLPPVTVDPRMVQESGLLKDIINLDVPDESGNVATVLLRRGTDKLRAISAAWADYAKAQAMPERERVKPLMVLQVPNAPAQHSRKAPDAASLAPESADDEAGAEIPDTGRQQTAWRDDIGKWLDVIFTRWPDLPPDCVANVFGEHRTEEFGGRTVPYVAPERVDESRWVRILIAKDAISTGWDCPRAEVMVSFRPATEKTHIAQLLGRMVRTPLARRIPGHERLGAVDCLLPHFNKNSVEAVVSALMTGGDGGEELPGRRVLVNPQEMKPNPDIAEDVWQKLLSLPSQSLPKKQSHEVKRLTSLAHYLAFDGLLPDAGAIAHTKMHKMLDSLQTKYPEAIREARHNVLRVEGLTLTTDVRTGTTGFDAFVERADMAVIEELYHRARRVFSPDLARSYSEYLAENQLARDDDDDTEALNDAHTLIAAMGQVPDIESDLKGEAEKWCNRWLDDYRVAIKNLSDERQEDYRRIREMSSDPRDVDLSRPKTRLELTTEIAADGTRTAIPRYPRHLLCDATGQFPCNLNAWEERVVSRELARENTVAWYRNPSRAGQDSLGVIYRDGEEVKIMRPDFIFFTRLDNGSIAANILDPHGTQFGDALPKLQGLAAYAKTHHGVYRRIEVYAETEGARKVIDLTESQARTVVEEATTITQVYESSAARPYTD